MEIDYNVKAFIYVLILAIVGVILMILGHVFNIEYAFIVGGILFLVATLVTFVLTGIVFALRMYSEDSGFMDQHEQN